MVHAAGRARIRHATTGDIHEIDAAEVEFDEMDSEERAMGAETAYMAVIDHLALGQLVWTLWEYPIGAENDRETDVGENELLDNIEFGLSSPTSAEIQDGRVQKLVDWFFENYQDPAHETPYNGREGGYIYINGGPFDAHTELESNFPEEDESIIEAAVEEVQSDGMIDWAPVRGDEDLEDYYESMRHEEVATDETALTQTLEALIDALPVPQMDPLFSVSDAGVVNLMMPADAANAPNDDPLFDELKEAIATLSDKLAGTNAHTDMLKATQRYNDALFVDAFSVQRLYGRGVKIQNVASDTQSRIENGDLPELPDGAASDLASVLDLHAAYIMSKLEGQALFNGAKQFLSTEDKTEQLRSAAEMIGAAVEEAKETFSEDVREAVKEVVGDIGRGPHPDRSTQVAATTLGNLGMSLLKSVRDISLGTFVGGALGASGMGAVMITGGGAGIDALWAFLVVNAQAFHLFAGALGADLGWAEPMGQVFKRLSAINIGGGSEPKSD